MEQTTHRNVITDIKEITKMKMSVKMLLVLSLLTATAFVYAGSLEPSAAPGSTMKTLDQVEARTPIPGSDSAAGTFWINESGSYYLTANRLASDMGIYVNADDVTLDLNGFTLEGSDSSYGIYMYNRSNVKICNGTVKNFFYGISEVSGSGSGHKVVNVSSIGNAEHGIYLLCQDCTVRDCYVYDNGYLAESGVYGIFVSSNGQVLNNTLRDNGNAAAAGNSVTCIYANSNSIVSGNTIYDNGQQSEASVRGILVGSGSRVSNNTISGNGDSALDTFYGIYTYYGSDITGNTVNANGYHCEGDVYCIYTYEGNTIADNMVYSNATYGTGTYIYGIKASTGCKIVGNNCRSNGHSSDANVYGISVGSGSSVIANTVNYNGQLSTGASRYGVYASTYCVIDQNTIYNNGGTNLYASSTCQLGINVAP